MIIVKIRLMVRKIIDKIKALKYNIDIDNLLTRTFCLRLGEERGFMKKEEFSNLFKFDGDLSISQAFPLALQHVIAMIAACVAPVIILTNAIGLEASESVMLVQMALIGSAITTLLMIYPIGKFGSRLPMIYGVSFAYIPTMLALGSQFQANGPKGIVAIVLGAQLIAAIVSLVFAFTLKYILPYFPPLVSGTVVLCIGISLYPVALTNMGGAGDVTAAGWGAWQNWLVAIITLIASIGFTHFGKGIVSLASLLFAMLVGYVFSFFFGMIDLSPVGDASLVSLVKPLHFGISLEPSAIFSFIIIFIVTSIEGIGDMTSTTVGGMDRTPTGEELRGGLAAFSLTNIIGAFTGTLPTATFSQNAGIVSVNKVINKKVFSTAALIILLAGFSPKLSALLTTIPDAVIGGATLSVFAIITMNGIKMITSQPLTTRNTSIVGTSVALGFGFTSVVSVAESAGVVFMPEFLKIAIGSSPVVLAAIAAVLMNVIIPENEEDKAKEDSLS
ncbi:MAG: solute carrier family 23 protein [Peptoniphilaceae bacterium]|nr:solute carrier family 23 protein [Peptoniphilaceae bacterium]